LDDTSAWTNVSGYHKANGGEQYITIGNFTPYANTHLKLVRIGSNPSGQLNRYYLDDVSLTPVSLQPTNNDTSMCDGDSILWNKRADFNSCIWNDGDTSSNRYVKQAGTYFITNISGNVSITDTITIVTLSNNNNYTPSYCNGQTLTLQAATAQSYRWNTLTTAPSILVNQPGTYWVKRSNAGCSVTDTFRVTQYPLPNLNHLTDTVVCFEEGAQLTLTVGNFKQQLWQPMGDTTASILIQTPQQITVTVTVTDSNTCIATKSILIGNSCSDFVFIPNAFSPNDDGLNDVFKPITLELEFYELTIVNRWGQILFTTQNIEEGWDGKNASAGVYIAHLTYKVKGKKEQKTLQSITLLR
jgi:gliding motility-associated-like protein